MSSGRLPPTPPANRLEGRWRYGWVWAAIWLAYLAQPLREAWQNDDPKPRMVGVTTIALFAVCFVVAFRNIRTTRRRGRQIPATARWGMLAVLTALMVAAMPAVGQGALGMLTYVVVTAFFAVPVRAAMALSGAAMLVTAVLPYAVPGWEPQYGVVFTIFVTSVAMWGIVSIIERNAQLAAAHSEIARLAVADERNRFARDLHDILGHTLTVITVKAELAGRLVQLAPERAEAEIAELEGIARQALRDVRDAVGGYREVTLASELASARTALTAAGIEAELPDTVDEVPADRQEIFGWVVREGVTNVVRHSSATRCRIRLTPTEIEITDDGSGPSRLPDNVLTAPDGRPGPGHGLAGLRERTEAAGGSLSVGRSPAGGFALRARVP
jgi:two-component system sensor histidine kinase DesK